MTQWQRTAPPKPLSTPKERQSFRRKLLAWFDKHKRDMPWRRTRDPYQIWLSEIMLQQTTVAMAGPKFTAFVAAFPTVHALAAADEQQVLRMWEGLGYYRRARGLHAAAKVIVAEHDGELPRDVKSLMALPGVGRYTAGAVASFAYDVLGADRRNEHAARPRPAHRLPRRSRRRGRAAAHLARRRIAAADHRRRQVQPRADGARRPRLQTVRSPLRRVPRHRALRRVRQRACRARSPSSPPR